MQKDSELIIQEAVCITSFDKVPDTIPKGKEVGNYQTPLFEKVWTNYFHSDELFILICKGSISFDT